MVEIVFQEVVLGEVFEVGMLNEGQVGVCEDADIHGDRRSAARESENMRRLV